MSEKTPLRPGPCHAEILPMNRWFNIETGELMYLPSAMLFYDKPDPWEVEWARKRREEIAQQKAEEAEQSGNTRTNGE